MRLKSEEKIKSAKCLLPRELRWRGSKYRELLPEIEILLERSIQKSVS